MNLLVIGNALVVLGHPVGVVLGVVRNAYRVLGIGSGDALYSLALLVVIVEAHREGRFALFARASGECIALTGRSVFGIRVVVAIPHHQRVSVQLVVIPLVDIHARQGVRHLGLSQARLGHIEGRGPGDLVNRHLRCGFLQVSRCAGADIRGARAGLAVVVMRLVGHPRVRYLARHVDGSVVGEDIDVGISVALGHLVGIRRASGLLYRVSTHDFARCVLNGDSDITLVLHDVLGSSADRVGDGAASHGHLGFLVVSDGPGDGLHVSLARRLARGLGQARVVDAVVEVLVILTGRVVPVTLDGDTILGLIDRTLAGQLAVVNGGRILQDHLLAVGHPGDGVGKAIALLGGRARRGAVRRGIDIVVVGQRRASDGVGHDYILVGTRRCNGHRVVHLAIAGVVPAPLCHGDVVGGIDGDVLCDAMAEVQSRHIGAELAAEREVKLDVICLGELLEIGVVLIPPESHLAVGTDSEGVVRNRDGLLRSVCIRVLDSYVDVRAVAIRLKSGGQLIGKVAAHVELGVFALCKGDLHLIVLPRLHGPGARVVPSGPIVRRQGRA